MASRVTAEQLMRKMVALGFKVGEKVVVKFEKGECSETGCSGVVGNTWPISLVDVVSGDGAVLRCLLAYPCDTCGKLHSSPSGKHALEASDGSKIFLRGKTLNFTDVNGGVVRTSQTLIRAIVGED